MGEGGVFGGGVVAVNDRHQRSHAGLQMLAGAVKERGGGGRGQSRHHPGEVVRAGKGRQPFIGARRDGDAELGGEDARQGRAVLRIVRDQQQFFHGRLPEK